MDRWLAQAIRGSTLGPGMMLGGPFEAPNLWEAQERMSRALGALFRRSPYRNHFHEVLITGLHARGKRGVSYIQWSLRHDPRSPSLIQVTRGVIRRPIRGQGPTKFIGAVSDPVTQYFHEQLQQRNFESPDLVERLLIDIVRRASEANPGTVGDDVLVSRLNFGDTVPAEALFTFSPGPALRAKAVGDGSLLSAWTPWVLTPDSVVSPQKIAAPGIAWGSRFLSTESRIDVAIKPIPGLIAATTSAFRRGAPRADGRTPSPVSALTQESVHQLRHQFRLS